MFTYQALITFFNAEVVFRVESLDNFTEVLLTIICFSTLFFYSKPVFVVGNASNLLSFRGPLATA